MPVRPCPDRASGHVRCLAPDVAWPGVSGEAKTLQIRPAPQSEGAMAGARHRPWPGGAWLARHSDEVRPTLGTAAAEAYDRAVNREDGVGVVRPVDVLRTLFLLGKLAVLGLALLVLLVVLGLVPRRRRAVFA
jgi:hypothetical protein